MGAAARQECPEGQGRALDEEERCELLRLQEPPRRGQGAQADPQMGCDGRGRARQSEAGRCLDLSNTGKGVWADSAYRSVQIEAGLKAKGLQSRIHRRAARNRPLSERQKSANTTRSKVRARVEHVFGQQQSSMGGKIVRTIGIARARFKIGMMNLGYNIRRLVQLERMAPAPA